MTYRVGILLLPQFPMMAFSAVIEPLRVANHLGANPEYSWHTVSAAEASVVSSSGIRIEADHAAESAPPVDMLVVCSGGNADRYDSRAAQNWIRAQDRNGAMIGAVADGAFFLGRIGLLDHCTTTLHWQSQAAFREAFPHLSVASELYIIDGMRFTSAGGIGAFDMMLDLIDRQHGGTMSAGIAQWFVHSRIRVDADRELLSVRLRTGVTDSRVLRAISIMEGRLEDLMSIDDIAGVIGISDDTLARLFVASTNLTPAKYYRCLRLRRAQDLLSHSTMKISEIAPACGFEDPSGFARAYREMFGISPRDQRRGARA